MHVTKWLYSCAMFYAVLLKMVTGSITQEQSLYLETGMEESVPGQVSSLETTMHPSTTLDPCLLLPGSPACYESKCRADDPFCIMFLLFNAPENVRLITGKEYSDRPVGLFSVVDSIISGLQLAVEECKHQFAWKHWNCPVATDAILAEPIHSTGTRGISYLQAISAAAVMHSVIKTCAHRENDLCKCGRISKAYDQKFGKNSNRHEGSHFIWGGCPDNVRFGETVSEQFFKANLHTKEMSNITKLIKWHNERVGRTAVKKSVRVKCRCHGASGGCAAKTCWTAVADLRTVGDFLWEKHERSRLVTDVDKVVRDNIDNDVNNSTNATAPSHEKKPMNDLAYFAQSPSYCLDNYTAGYPGTVGRECLKGELSSSRGSDSSCDIMCCGREVEKVEYEELYECECKQLWCCTSRCKHCKRKMTKYFCK